MSTNPSNYLQAEAALDNIVEEASTYNDRVDRAIQHISTAYDELAAMASKWTTAATYIENQATANPDDALWQELKARKDQIVTDFQAMRDRAQAIRDAANGAA